MGGKEDAPFGGENIARRRRRYGWRFCACMQLKGWSKGVLKVCLVNYEREECVHIFLHEKGWRGQQEEVAAVPLMPDNYLCSHT